MVMNVVVKTAVSVSWTLGKLKEGVDAGVVESFTMLSSCCARVVLFYIQREDSGKW